MYVYATMLTEQTDNIQHARMTCFTSLLKSVVQTKDKEHLKPQVNTSQTSWSVSRGTIETHASIRSKLRGVSSPRAARSQRY